MKGTNLGAALKGTILDCFNSLFIMPTPMIKSSQGIVMCTSCAKTSGTYHLQHVTYHMVQRNGTAVKFDWVETAVTVAEYHLLKPLIKEEMKPEYPLLKPLIKEEMKPEYPLLKPLIKEEMKPEYPLLKPLIKEEMKPEYLLLKPLIKEEMKPEYPLLKPLIKEEMKPEYPERQSHSVFVDKQTKAITKQKQN